MLEENTKHHWLKIGAIALLTFIVSFLAFYIVMEIMYHRMTDPVIQFKRFEKMIQHEQRDMRKLEGRMESPFVPTMRPMMVNLVKENDEYKVIIDLTPFDNDENGINVNLEDKVLKVSGEIDKKSFGNEKIINFSQSYYLDEDLDIEKMTREKRGHKLIVTIPFKD